MTSFIDGFFIVLVALSTACQRLSMSSSSVTVRCLCGCHFMILSSSSSSSSPSLCHPINFVDVVRSSFTRIEAGRHRRRISEFDTVIFSFVSNDVFVQGSSFKLWTWCQSPPTSSSPVLLEAYERARGSKFHSVVSPSVRRCWLRSTLPLLERVRDRCGR